MNRLAMLAGALSVTALGMSARAAHLMLGRTTALAPMVSTPPVAASGSWPVDSLVAWGEHMRAHNLFHGSRVALDLPVPLEDASTEEYAPPPPIVPLAPVLSLQGLLGTAGRWEAIVAGIPGRDGGVLLRVGESASGFRLRAADATWAVLDGPDSTLRLTLRQRQP